MCSAPAPWGQAASSNSATTAGSGAATWSSSRSKASACSGTPLADVAVVGAGVNGLATTWALRRRGIDAVVYEQFELGHTRGSSHGRSRIFRLAYPEGGGVRRAPAAPAGWRELEEESGEQLLLLNGMLELYHEGVVSSQDALEECDVACERLAREEAEERFGVSPPPDTYVLFQPDAGIVYSDRALRAF